MFRQAMIFAAALALCTPTAAQTSRPKVSLTQAVSTAERELDARAYDAELDMEQGVLVYEIELVRDGRPIEARVDASTGRIVRQTSPFAPRLPWRAEQLRIAQSAPRSLTETISLVEGATKGQVWEIGLERRNGRHYYEVELTGAQDREVLVDVRTGAITPLLDD